MVEIMYHIHKYVPLVITEDDPSTTEIPSRSLIQKVLFGGDQLTAARARGAQRAKVNSFIPTLRLDGIIPCAEDWHTKMNFLEVCKCSCECQHASCLLSGVALCRWYGNTSTPRSQLETTVHCIICATSSVAQMLSAVPRMISTRVMISLVLW